VPLADARLVRAVRSLLVWLVRTRRAEQTKGVDHDVPLAPVDQLAAVEATAVRSDDGCRRCW
jgi:hypothetical protein